MIPTIEKQKRIKQLRTDINSGDIDIDARRAYFIQLETLLPVPTKTLYVDADSLIYYSAYSPSNIDNCLPIEGGTFIGDKIEFSLEDAFNSLVNAVVQSCKEESLLGNMIPFDGFKLVYTPSTNFRYDIFPEYKYRRLGKEESLELKELKKLVKPKGLIVEGVEADDVVAYYARRGHPIASGDKDVIYGVEGNNYFYHNAHRKVVKVSKEEGERFVLLQTLVGDSTDDIPGIKGVGMKTKLLPEGGTFEDVVKIYENHIICMKCWDDPKGRATTYDKIEDLECDGDVCGTCPKCECNRMFYQYTKEDAILTRRLVGLDQWKGNRRGLKLWEY